MTPYRFGIEEEYFVSDMRTRNVRHTMSKRFFRGCKKELGDAVMNEIPQRSVHRMARYAYEGRGGRWY